MDGFDTNFYRVSTSGQSGENMLMGVSGHCFAKIYTAIFIYVVIKLITGCIKARGEGSSFEAKVFVRPIDEGGSSRTITIWFG